MVRTMTFTAVRKDLATLLDEVFENREIVRIARRKGGEVSRSHGHGHLNGKAIVLPPVTRL
jgi:hypothetical protein